jgi:tetratricopeptide (TPR) repeat protein
MRISTGLALGLIPLMGVPTVVQAQSIEALFRQGSAAAAAGAHEEAEAIWRQVLRLDPSNGAAYENLGNALTNQGRYSEAVAAYRQSLRLDDRYASTYYNLGIALQGQGLDAEAEAAYRQALRINPNYGSAYNNLGTVLVNQGNLTGALDAYRAATRVEPSAIHYGNLGYVYAALGRDGDAEAAYQQAIQLDPGMALLYSDLGYLYQRQGRYGEAQRLLEQALSLDPNLVLAQNNLAELRRLLALQSSAPVGSGGDLAWLPRDEPLLPILRSVVRVVTTTPTGIQYGTGWVVKREGDLIWILTNRHVVTAFGGRGGPLGDEVEVDLFSEPPDEQPWLRLPAAVVAATEPQADWDVALLVVEGAPADIQPLMLARAGDQGSRGSLLTIIGHPTLGFPWTVDEGVLSNRNAQQLQISQAALGPGSSGSPVLNGELRVIGMVVEAVDPREPGTTAGFGFAYRLDYLQPVLEEWGLL